MATTTRTTPARRTAAPKATAPKKTTAKRPVAATRTTPKKTTARKATAARSSKPSVTTVHPAPKVEVPQATAPTKRTGPVLVGYRYSLKALEAVTVGVGGFSLGSLGELGLPRSFSDKLKGGHRKAIHGATHVSDVVGTKAAHVVGQSVSLASGAAKYVFPA